MSYESEVLADSPVLYYRLNEASGSTVEDFSGSNRDAAYVNSPTLGATGATTDGDDAVTMNGTNQYVTVASSSAGDTALKAMTGSFSLECWVNPSSLSGNRGLFDRYAGGGGTTSVFLFYLVGATPTFIIRNAANSDSTKSAASGISTGVWTHLVATYDGSTSRIYINGTESGTGLSTTFSSHNRTPILEIGRFVFSNTYFAGTLDEVAVYPSALSSTRVLDHYNAATATGLTVNLDRFTSAATMLDVTVASSLQVDLDRFTAAATMLDVTLPNVTNVDNELDGRQRSGMGTVTITRPVVTPPPGLVLARTYDKALAYPTPTMVDGRPT